MLHSIHLTLNSLFAFIATVEAGLPIGQNLQKQR